MTPQPVATARQVNSPAQVLFASLIGTTIEFFDFYIYATAAVLDEHRVSSRSVASRLSAGPERMQPAICSNTWSDSRPPDRRERSRDQSPSELFALAIVLSR